MGIKLGEDMTMIYMGKDQQLLKQGTAYKTKVMIEEGYIKIRIDTVTFEYGYVSQFWEDWATIQ